jgi:imidazoleglycerol phosphate synthase cyclase subunit
MLMRRVIACLDVRDGRVVKGVRFESLRDMGDPAALAALYEAQGADEIVMLDVSATPEGRATAAATVRRIRRELGIPLTVGGGVRATDDVARLLDAGADKVGINTAAVRTPELVDEASSRFGAQCVVVAIDGARCASMPCGREVVVRSGSERTAMDVAAWAREVERRGAGEVLLTSVDRDGTGQGYDIEMTRCVSSAVGVPVVASGGATSPGHLAEALAAGADAVLIAGVLHRGETTVGVIKAALAAKGVEVRL